MTRRPAFETVCIVGPTASGKSALAERVALALGSEIVSVDAMQVYRGMDIGTAKSRNLACPMHMVDLVEVTEPYSAARFQREARSCIDGILERGLSAVLCGGTGLYLDAVIDDLRFPHGETHGARRQRYERMAAELGPKAVHDELKSRDAASAALIDASNLRRVIRALEMLDEGESYAKTHEGLKRRKPWYRASIWAIRMDRVRLYARIDARVDKMFEDGLVEEVRRLAERGLSSQTTAGQAIGYKELLAAFAGQCTVEEARELIKTRTRHYAKRQLSWLRRDGRCTWLDYDQIDEAAAVQQILAACGGGGA